MQVLGCLGDSLLLQHMSIKRVIVSMCDVDTLLINIHLFQWNLTVLTCNCLKDVLPVLPQIGNDVAIAIKVKTTTTTTTSKPMIWSYVSNYRYSLVKSTSHLQKVLCRHSSRINTKN